MQVILLGVCWDISINNDMNIMINKQPMNTNYFYLSLISSLSGADLLPTLEE